MRKIFLFMNVSLDGYVADSSNDISGFHNDFEAFSSDESQKVDTLLFGRNTYEMMKFWSTPQGAEMQPEIAKFMNATPKVVVSHTAFDPGWDKVTVISENVVGSITALKNQPGQNILIMGSSNLCLTLIQAGLIDEFQILVNPVVFGDGVSLFAGLPAKTNLTLTNTHTFKSGVVMLTYTPN